MSNTVDNLILDMLEWIGPRSRRYDEVIDAWRTSCPRLTVWEDANDRGYLEQRFEPGADVSVSVSPRGQAFLHEHRPR